MTIPLSETDKEKIVMAFADPQVVTIDGNNLSLPRVSTGSYTSTYRTDTGTDGSYVEMLISHQRGKRNRHVIRFNSNRVTEDPITEANLLSSASVTLTIDRPLTGLESEDVVDFIAGLCGFLTASSNANAVKLLSFQS